MLPRANCNLSAPDFVPNPPAGPIDSWIVDALADRMPTRPRPPSNHRLFYLPNASYWTMRKLVARHQFGSDCSRLLVLHDDAVGAGLGWTLRMTVYLLALAMSQNRTLVEAPASNTSDHRRGWRWCTAEPGTLQCFFRPWTHCQPPRNSSPPAEACRTSQACDRRPMAHVSMQDFLKRNSWYGLRRYVKVHHSRAFIDVLWRPRPWLEAHIECAERACAFGPDPYLVVSKSRRGGGEVAEKLTSSGLQQVHMRDSPEKTRERGRMPSMDDYALCILNGSKVGAKWARCVHCHASRHFVADPRHPPRPICARRPSYPILWQTANPTLLAEAISWSVAQRRRFCHTNNSRSRGDVWGGINLGLVDEAALTGMVNGLLGRRASGVLSSGRSMWTGFLTMGRPRVELQFPEGCVQRRDARGYA